MPDMLEESSGEGSAGHCSAAMAIRKWHCRGKPNSTEKAKVASIYREKIQQDCCRKRSQVEIAVGEETFQSLAGPQDK